MPAGRPVGSKTKFSVKRTPLTKENFYNDLWVLMHDHPDAIKINGFLGILANYVNPPSAQALVAPTIPIPPSFEAFVRSLPIPCNEAQLLSMQQAIAHREYAWLCNRKWGKTEKMAGLATWYGLQKYDGSKPHLKSPWMMVIWYSAGEDQLIEVRASFKQLKPYVTEVQADKVTLCNGNEIRLHIITEKQTHSPECDKLFLDEGRSVRVEQRKQYTELRHCIAASDRGNILHGSTPGWETAIMDSAGPQSALAIAGCVETHNYRECPWILPETVEAEREALADWEFDLNYEGKWTVPGGAVFRDIDVIPDASFPECPNHLKKCGGVDFNGEPGNILLACYFNATDIWVFDCVVFEDNDTGGLQDYIATMGYDTEQELGGYNDGFAKDVSCAGQEATHEWRGERIAWAKRHHIHVKASLTEVIKDFQGMPYQPDGTTSIKMFHYVAAGLHAFHEIGDHIFVPKQEHAPSYLDEEKERERRARG